MMALTGHRSYICSLHFVGQNNNNNSNNIMNLFQYFYIVAPDPVFAITSTENISNNPNLRLAYKTQH
jgi:hypothetical protein